MYDVHTHVIPPDVIQWLKSHAHDVNAAWIKRDPAKADFLRVNGTWEFELKEAFINPALYLEEQEQAGVTHSLVSPIPQLFLYDCPAAVTAELASVYNRSLAAWAGAHQQRLSALATVTLQEPARAANELRDAMGLGLKGAIIATSWSGNLLSHEKFAPFWEEADHQKAILFLHPLLSVDARLGQRMMANLIGVPWETTVCAVDLMLSGLMDKYPNVKILLAHGGGYLPYQIGRLETGYAKWKAVNAHLQASPHDYLKRFWYDTVLWNPAGIRCLIDLVGGDRVVPGSDYPFDLCAWPPDSSGATGFQTLMAE
ncbi:amidohydrolase family protein [Brevibacillus thermoruber]|jgi:aminocarboxymuconate-semialdehyde decarboxylase|uniref:Amidohydrolase family protein n=1 Tax=Brevibacillus thermoruber TaxID=33942 RepID=A0A9X3TU46_9BACL|nr:MULTISPECIES: amidohydrolase family protein [Brevibacillus]MDA5110469.1 amidohydrolase family protein [Brevibacillus thermoruber]UYZ14804.1 amidohydrolase [Brevibacillus sp. WF146]